MPVDNQLLMSAQDTHSTHSLSHIRLFKSDLTRILPIPLDFECEPVDILTKQLTNLNSTHDYRVSYLGPRWPTSLALNKKLAAVENDQQVPNALATEKTTLSRYSFAFEQTSRHSTFMDAYYRNQEHKTGIYYRAFEGMNPTLPEQDSLRFDASFESANLDCAIKVSEDEYDLFLRVDSNTRGHTQWFYFEVSSPKKRKVQLNICNLGRGRTLYEKGMKPFVLSRKSLEKWKMGWQQSSSDVRFQPTKLRYNFLYERMKARQYWTLSFTVQFQYEGDSLYIAYCVPYTYSQLLSDIEELKTEAREIMTSGLIGRSRMGLQMPAMVITDPKVEDTQKKVVLLVGRIHPGQSNGSIVLWGLVKQLCSKESRELRKNTVFVVVPMVNPDGVVLGNSRTGVLGKDLNRQYNNPNKQFCPQLQNIKRLVVEIQRTHGVFMFLDFHGHSQRKNAFMYGPEYPLSDLRHLKCKVLPKLVSLRTEMFRYYSCSFKIAEDKQSTGRAYMLSSLSIPYTYTVQSSNGFYYNSQSLITYEFSRAKWLELGECIANTLEEYFRYLIEYEEFLKVRRQAKVNSKKARKEELIDKKESSRAKLSKSGEDEEIIKSYMPTQTKLYFASILDDIRVEDLPKDSPMDESVDSDEADQKDDMDPTKQANLRDMILGHARVTADRPASTDIAAGRFQILTERRKKDRASMISKRVKKSATQKKRDFKDSEKQILQEYGLFNKQSREVRRLSDTGKSTPQLELVPRTRDFSRTEMKKSAPWVKHSRKHNSCIQEEEETNLQNIINWNIQKQLIPDVKLLSSSRPIQIGKDIPLPGEEERTRSRMGFSGSDWCTKIRRRMARKQATIEAQEKEDNTSTLSQNIIKTTARLLITKAQKHKPQTNSIDYNRFIKTFIQEQSQLCSNPRASLTGQMKHRRQSSAKRTSVSSKIMDESSDFLQVRKYQ